MVHEMTCTGLAAAPHHRTSNKCIHSATALTRMPASLATFRLRISKACFLSLCLSSRAAGFVVQAGPSSALFATAPTSSASSSSSVREGSMAEGSSSYPRGSKPAREAETSKPKLWIYDHCPYCVRPRMVLGLKGIPHDLVYLSNDDIDTPAAMAGKKVVPILELGKPGTDSHEILIESLDITRRLDEDPAFGPPALAAAAGRKDIEDWVASSAMLMRRLLRPRHAVTPLPEFQTRSAREAFIRNHPLPEPSSYADNLKDSPKLIEELERALWKLEAMIHSPDSVAADGKLSYDDVTFFPRMRGLTIIRDLGIPPKLRAYLDAVSERCDIPLHDKIAS